MNLFTSEHCPGQGIEENLAALYEAFDPSGIVADLIDNLLCGKHGMSP